jgi:hypothetical protein
MMISCLNPVNHHFVTYSNKYIAEHKITVLAKLIPPLFYANLSDVILLCWEVPGVECHRSLIAEWLQEYLEIVVPAL